MSPSGRVAPYKVPSVLPDVEPKGSLEPETMSPSGRVAPYKVPSVLPDVEPKGSLEPETQTTGVSHDDVDPEAKLPAVLVTPLAPEAKLPAGLDAQAKLLDALQRRLASFENEHAQLRRTIARLESERAEPAAAADSCADDPDPETNPEVWNLNAMSVAVWKSTCWPIGQRWNHHAEKFEPHHTRNPRRRSRASFAVETVLWGFWLTAFPLMYLFLTVAMLAGVLDEGLNMRAHIYGDWMYQSPIWRYSSEADLKMRWVPKFDELTNASINTQLPADVTPPPAPPPACAAMLPENA
jgi:hypothetical protein